MTTCVETVFSLKLGDEAIAIARRWKDDVEVAIYDSANYGVILTSHQWKRMLYYAEFLNNGLDELKKAIQEKNGKTVIFEEVSD
jgi:hypothetical protein